jgi:hypothetical protein
VANLSGLEVRDFRLDDRDSWLRTFEAVFGAPLGRIDGREHFDWLYLRNPDGRLWITIATPPASDEVAASYSTIPRRFWVYGSERLGALSLDTLTGSAWRKRGLFVHLAQLTYARAAREGGAFVYGFPNENSAPGFLKHLGWKLLRSPTVVATVQPVAWLAHLSGRTTPSERSGDGLRLRVTTEIDTRFDELWRRTRPRLSVAAVRDRAFVAWRWSRPRSRYEVAIAENEAGDLVAACLTTVETRSEGPRVYLVDFLAPSGCDDALARLIRFATGRRVRADGARLIQTMIAPDSPLRAALPRFRRVPSRLAMPIVLGAADLAPGGLPDDVNWHVTYADTDTI